MSNEAVFSFANMVVLPGWILLAAAPQSKWTQRYAALLVPLLLGPVYVVLIATNWGPGGFGTLNEVAQLFSHPALLLAGWIHYLIFDLFVGAWETRDAAAHGISRIVVIPCLLLTFLLGPAGLGAYLLMRLAWKRAVDPK